MERRSRSVRGRVRHGRHRACRLVARSELVVGLKISVDVLVSCEKLED
jgi:hypothetical protein